MKPVKKRERVAKADARKSRRKNPVYGDVPPVTSPQAYVFRLFVSGSTDKSTRAINNIKKICEAHFAGKYQLDVVDVYQQPQLATGEQIVAVPTLVKKSPGKVKKILGDLTNTKEFIRKLE